MFRRSRENLASWFTVSMGSVLIGFAGVIYVVEAQDQRQVLDQRLYEICQLMAAAVEDGSYQDRQRVDLEDVPILGEEALPFPTVLVYARWYGPDQELIQFYGPIPPERIEDGFGFATIKHRAIAPAQIPPFQAAPAQINSSQDRPARLRQLTLPVFEDHVLIGYLQVAAPLTAIEADLWELRLVLVIAVVVTLGLVTWIGWMLGGLAMQPIRQSYDQLQQFTGDASHELRTPLAAIINHAQVGLMDLANPDEQKLRLEKIIQGAESMAKLVGDLLLLARSEGKLSPDHLHSVDLIQILQHLAADYREQARDRSLDWAVTLPEPPLYVQAQSDLLQRAIANLLSNAIQYTASGGIHLSAQRQDRTAVIQVKDTGMGIDADQLPHIFERFYRVDKARSRRTGGFGLGLAIVEQIIHAHHGQIAVSSQLDQGTTVRVTLPLHD
ncbi:MAG: sensor histidine kinase [Thainema sp.]